MTPRSPYIRYGGPPFPGGSNHKQQRVVGAVEPLEVGSSLLPIQDRVAVGRPARPAQGRSACARRCRGRLGSFRGVGTWAFRHLSNFRWPSKSLRLARGVDPSVASPLAPAWPGITSKFSLRTICMQAWAVQNAKEASPRILAMNGKLSIKQTRTRRT